MRTDYVWAHFDVLNLITTYGWSYSQIFQEKTKTGNK